MQLALILNKDMKTNFENLNDTQIESLGSIEFTNIFTETLLEFLEILKENENHD